MRKQESALAPSGTITINSAAQPTALTVPAGLLPALNRGDLPDSQTWQVDIFSPGDDPLRSPALASVGRLMPEASPVDRLTEARIADLERRLRIG